MQAGLLDGREDPVELVEVDPTVLDERVVHHHVGIDVGTDLGNRSGLVEGVDQVPGVLDRTARHRDQAPDVTTEPVEARRRRVDVLARPRDVGLGPVEVLPAQGVLRRAELTAGQVGLGFDLGEWSGEQPEPDQDDRGHDEPEEHPGPTSPPAPGRVQIAPITPPPSGQKVPARPHPPASRHHRPHAPPGNLGHPLIDSRRLIGQVEDIRRE